MRTSILLRTALLPILATSFACSNERDPSEQGPPPTTLDSVALTVDLQSIALGESVTAHAVARYSDGTEKSIDDKVTWASSNPTVLEPVAETPGMFKSKAKGTAVISGTLGESHGMVSVTITDPKVMTVELIPNSGEIGMGGFLSIEAVASYSNGKRETVTKTVEWASDAVTVLRASALEKGRLITFGMGQAMITATVGGITGSGTYNVVGPRIDYIQISPSANVRINAGAPVQFTAQGHWSNDTFADVSHDVVWSSSDPTIATIDANGLATQVGDGEVAIKATSGNITAATLARTVSSNCPYPEGAPPSITYDAQMPGYFWLDALDVENNVQDFRLESLFCDSATHPTVIFVVTAGWCPYCPDYMRMVDEQYAELEAAGALVVYVVIETASGAPATNVQADGIVDREVTSSNFSIRVGDGATTGGLPSPFSAAVSFLPNAFVVRTRDMHVIASREHTENLDFVQIARNPERLY